MIELEINGSRQRVDPPSARALRDLVHRSLAPGHLIKTLNVNGRAIDEEQLEEFDVGSLRSVSVDSATPEAIARESLAETIDWIGRIGTVLESISKDFRVGKEQHGRSRLTDVIDALQVLVSLLQGIQRFLRLDPDQKVDFEQRWSAAEMELLAGVKGLLSDLESGDPVHLADRTGYSLPRALERFEELLRWVNG